MLLMWTSICVPTARFRSGIADLSPGDSRCVSGPGDSRCVSGLGDSRCVSSCASSSSISSSTSSDEEETIALPAGSMSDEQVSAASECSNYK